MNYVNPWLSLMSFVYFIVAGFISFVLSRKLVEKYTLFWPDAAIPQIELFGKSISLLGSGFWFLVGFNEEFSKLLVLLAVV